MSVNIPDVVWALAAVTLQGEGARFIRNAGFASGVELDEDGFLLTLQTPADVTEASVIVTGRDGYAAVYTVLRPSDTQIRIVPLGADGILYPGAFDVLVLKYPTTEVAATPGTPVTPSDQSPSAGAVPVALARRGSDGGAIGPQPGISGVVRNSPGNYAVTLSSPIPLDNARVFIQLTECTPGSVAIANVSSTTEINVTAWTFVTDEFVLEDSAFFIAVYNAAS